MVERGLLLLDLLYLVMDLDLFVYTRHTRRARDVWVSSSSGNRHNAVNDAAGNAGRSGNVGNAWRGLRHVRSVVLGKRRQRGAIKFQRRLP